MKKKHAKARQPKPRKAGRAAAAAPLSCDAAPPAELPAVFVPCDDEALSIEAMLRAQLEETHLVAMDCLLRARTAESPELRDRALTHATRLLSLFGRQVNALERRGGRPAARPRTAGAARDAGRTLADATARALAEAAASVPEDDPAEIAALLPGGHTPAPPQAAAPSGP